MMHTDDIRRGCPQPTHTEHQPTAAPELELLELAQRLRGIADRVEDFVSEQCRRLLLALQDCAGGIDAEPDGASSSEWEEERRRLLEQIQRDRVLLADAWERLEVEQRRLLAERAALADAAAHQMRRSRPSAETVVMLTEKQPPTQHTPRDALAAVRQFRQLRQEIDRHSQRKS
jgi:hypothetical protein